MTIFITTVDVSRSVDMDRTVGLVIKWGLILVALIFVLWVLGVLLGAFAKMKLQSDINKHGLADVVIREIDRVTYDDTLAHTIMGHEVAGSLGAVLGALSGRQREQIKSIRFWIKLGNGEKLDVTLSPRDQVCQHLLRFIDNREFKAW